MDINQLILLVKNKIEKNIVVQNIAIKDKTTCQIIFINDEIPLELFRFIFR